MCVKHLRGKDRAVVAFSADEVWVLLVGPHDEGDKVSNIYTALYDLAGVPRPMTPRTKPACCNPAGSPPLMDELLLDDLVMRARRLALRRG
jgi:hypothetical protein